MNDAHEAGWTFASARQWGDRYSWDYPNGRTGNLNDGFDNWSASRKALWAAAHEAGWNTALQKYSDILDVRSPDISSVDNLSVAFKAWIKNGYQIPNKKSLP
jgi:hypothetical protein